MKVAILGASGILGQHMMVSQPPGVEAIFTRRTAGPLYESLDVKSTEMVGWLCARKFDVIVNMIGINNPDQVELDIPNLSCGFDAENSASHGRIFSGCIGSGAHLIEISSQAAIDPVNGYGKQKASNDKWLNDTPNDDRFRRWTILRPTFVLGIRPFPGIGRENPAERMLSGREMYSVDNRWFSVAFAWDVAAAIWKVVLEHEQHRGKTYQIGGTERLSRYVVAKLLGCNPEPVTHEHLMATGVCAADRPVDTTYKERWKRSIPLGIGMDMLAEQYSIRDRDSIGRRSWELSSFLGLPNEEVLAKLLQGFGPLHAAVTEDFNRTKPQTEAELLNWYRTTGAYLWELSAYHCDPGFNYAGMCRGIIERLKAAGAKRVLCLGDGIGTLTIAMRQAGLDAVYHDLEGSRTAAFAQARFYMRFGEVGETCLTSDFTPPDVSGFDAMTAMDFLEHCKRVPSWVEAIYRGLNPGGIMVSMNAFGMGSGPDGAMPMHLACNDRYVTEWDDLLRAVGFIQLGSNWYQRI